MHMLLQSALGQIVIFEHAIDSGFSPHIQTVTIIPS
jgi:hypothetical protein